MKALVLYYSRTGNTRLVARRIADELGAELEELTDRVNRRGVLGYLRSAREVALHRHVPLNPISHRLDDFDLVVVGTPVWRISLSSPIRTFLEDHANELPRVAFFCTMGRFGAGFVFRQMERLSHKVPIAKLSMDEGELGNGALGSKVGVFVDALRSRAEPRLVHPQPTPAHA